ncbi:hypothetical protein GA0115256_10518 [Streptomyces sp. DconLS]|nr:hypothetical protein [Streptomyces sp. SID4946]SCF60735.1 hypothetical protein GA0115256_10518 [Streptomyces sp. DconLS]
MTGLKLDIGKTFTDRLRVAQHLDVVQGVGVLPALGPQRAQQSGQFLRGPFQSVDGLPLG